MQKKFLCALAIFAVVAAMTFSEADACNRCRSDDCSGCQPGSYIPIPAIQPAPTYPICQSCGVSCSGPSYYPRQYCGGCLRRKTVRLVNNCNCGCVC